MSSVANASDAVVLGRRQLYMLPTRHGLMFCVLLAVLLLASVNYGNGLGYALTFLLGAVAVVSMLHTHRNLHRLRVAAGPCVPVFAGATAVFRIQLINEAPLPRLGVRLERGGARVRRRYIPRAAARLAGGAGVHARHRVSPGAVVFLVAPHPPRVALPRLSATGAAAAVSGRGRGVGPAGAEHARRRR